MIPSPTVFIKFCNSLTAVIYSSDCSHLLQKRKHALKNTIKFDCFFVLFVLFQSLYFSPITSHKIFFSLFPQKLLLNIFFLEHSLSISVKRKKIVQIIIFCVFLCTLLGTDLIDQGVCGFSQSCSFYCFTETMALMRNTLECSSYKYRKRLC